VIIVYGVAGYMLIDRWNLLDSFYMVIITTSTVGYTEIHPQSAAGRIFTSTLIVTGVATMLYGFGVFAETLADNAFGKYRRERQLERNLNQLRDHFIICGYGRIGTQIVAEFEDHKVAYAVIDQTEEAVGRLRAEGRLHFAGEHTSVWPGWMNGALESAQRVTMEVLAATGQARASLLDPRRLLRTLAARTA